MKRSSAMSQNQGKVSKENRRVLMQKQGKGKIDAIDNVKEVEKDIDKDVKEVEEKKAKKKKEWKEKEDAIEVSEESKEQIKEEEEQEKKKEEFPDIDIGFDVFKQQ